MMQKLKNNLSRFCGMYYRFRKILSEDQLMKTYNAYEELFFQYWVLAYASTDKTNLASIESKFKRILKTICFRREKESIEKITKTNANILGKGITYLITV